LGNDEKAAAAFETAEALSPGLTPPAEKAMEAVFENGAYVLKPENAQSPGPALTKARELAREGKLAEAATTLENILTKPDARHLEALVTLARIQRRAGRHEDALASLTSAGNLCATHEQLKTQKGQIEAGKARSLYDLGRRDEAAALWQTLADQPSSVGASLDVKNLVKAAASEPTGKPVEFEVPTPKAKDRLKAGVAAILRFHQLEEAATKLEGLELREAGMVGGDLNGMLDEILPDDLAYRWFSGEESTLAALMEEKLPALLTYYALIPGEGYRGTAAIVHGFDPGIRSFHLNDSRWLDTTDRMTSDRAAECRALVIAPAAFFEKTKILFPDQAFWQNYNRAERLAAENRFEDTYKELKVALSIKPDSFLTHLFLSAAAKRIGKDNEAYSAAAEATRLSRFDARPASTLGSFHGRRKKIEEAQKSFEAALAIEPAFTEPREFLARTLITRRDLEKGLAEADQLRHRFPNRPTGHYLRGSILSGQGNYAEAEHCLTVAAQLGTRASILDNLATVQVNLNKLPQAIQTLKRLYAIAEPEAARKVIEAKITLLRRRAEEVR
ncbi:MAG: tetratricopeptide repeat protein, partial [Verrucomicrobiota bacterium]